MYTRLQAVVSTATATKQCLQNGTWYKLDGLPWTDYTRCLDKSVSFYGRNYFTSTVTIFVHLCVILYRKKTRFPLHYAVTARLTNYTSFSNVCLAIATQQMGFSQGSATNFIHFRSCYKSITISHYYDLSHGATQPVNAMSQ